MSRTKSKGTFAENVVVEFIRMWYHADQIDPNATSMEVLGYTLINKDAASVRYPLVLTREQYDEHPDWERYNWDPPLPMLYEHDNVVIDPNAERKDWASAGFPFGRVTSEGSNDGGDVHGPFTAIEVKNHSDPKLSGLLSNAEWKAANAKKPYWFLCWKAAGRGVAGAGMWHTLTTVEEIVNGFGFNINIADVERLCDEGATMRLPVVGTAPGFQAPAFRWEVQFIFTSRQSGMTPLRDALWAEHYDMERRVIPIIISPRRGPDGMYPVERWYAYSKLKGMCRILETLGILPQEASEYVRA